MLGKQTPRLAHGKTGVRGLWLTVVDSPLRSLRTARPSFAVSGLRLNALDGWELSAVAEESHQRGVDEEAGAIAKAIGPAEVWANRGVRSRVVDHRDRRFFETECDASYFPDSDEVESLGEVAIVDCVDSERRRVWRVGVVEEVVSPPVAVHTAEEENEVLVRK